MHASRQRLSEHQLSLLNIQRRAVVLIFCALRHLTSCSYPNGLGYTVFYSVRLAFPYPPYHPLYRDGDVYMTCVQISSLATRSPFISQVEVLKRAPGITSRVFPACNACRNALTLTDSSSALNIA